MGNKVKEPHKPLEELVRGLKYSPQTGAMYRTSSRGKYSYVLNRDTKGYKRVSMGPTCYFQHRIAYYMMTGVYYRDHIDHGNGKVFDNRWDNLNRSSPKHNNMNKRVHRERGFIGVFKTPTDHHPWSAQLLLSEGVNFNLGRFQTIEAANRAFVWAGGHREMLREMHGNSRLCSLFRNHLRQLFEV